MIRHVANAEEWFTAVEKNTQDQSVLLVKFTATWCGPCRRIAPRFAQMAAAAPDVTFVEIDLDRVPRAAEMLNVRKVPTFVLLHQGIESARAEGAVIPAIEALVGRARSLAASSSATRSDAPSGPRTAPIPPSPTGNRTAESNACVESEAQPQNKNEAFPVHANAPPPPPQPPKNRVSFTLANGTIHRISNDAEWSIFVRRVMEENVPLVLQFETAVQTPNLEAHARSYTGRCAFASIDSSGAQKLARSAGVDTWPMILGFDRTGKTVGKVVGYDERRIQELIGQTTI